VKIERISAQAFRGYPSHVEVILSGDIVLLFGENGTGKTSLTEAFEWALFGTIVRKARSKTPGEYQGSSWIRNAHADSHTPTFAEVELVTGVGARHVVRRELIGNTTSLTIDGQPATDVTSLGLRTEDAFRPFLGQCEIQALIDSEQKDRWEQLSSILGFGEFGDMRQRLQRLRTDADHDPRVERTREIVRRTVQPLTPEGADPLEQSPDSLRERAARFLELDPSAGWVEIRRVASEQLEALYKRDRRPRGLERLLVGPDEVRGAAGDLKRAAEALVGQVDEHRRWHNENRRSVFAEEGLELLEDDHPEHCPFCAHDTLGPARLKDLRELASERPPRPSDSRADFEAARISIRAAGPLGLEVVPQILESLQGDDAEKSRLETIAAEQRELNALNERLAGLTEGLVAATDQASKPAGDPTPLASLSAQVLETADEIADRYAAIRVSVDQFMSSLVQRYTALTEPEQQRLSGLQQAKLLSENSRAVESAWKLRGFQAAFADLVTNLEAAERKEMEAALKTLSADTAKYYEEMSPGHRIKITGIRVRDNKRRQASLEATSHGKPVNPVTMFSEAEANCLGLSLYFSQRVDRNPSWDMIMLDDPVQSMDQGHEEGLLGLLTRIRREGNQIVVMTHSRKFAEQVVLQFRKVTSFTHYKFERGSGPEPRITIADGRIQDLLAFAEQNAAGEEVRREACAGAIRKAVERFCRDLGRKHDKKLKSRLKVSEMIDRLEDEGLLDDLEVGTLTRLARFGSRSSHEDDDRNPTESSILANSRELRELANQHLDAPPQLSLIEGGLASAS
jgi:DNA repair exonuclease SbcCD ATPase subunit